MLKFVALLSFLLSTGSSMVDVQQPKLLDEALGSSLVKQVSGPSHNVEQKALDAQVTKIFGSKYRIASSRYFAASADVSWVAISKSVQNQMLERSIKRSHYDSEKPGIVLVDFYPQPHGAFVLAMDRNAGRQGERLVGYFVLQAKGSH